MDDTTLLDHISQMVEEEKQLREAGGAPDAQAERLQRLKEQLDQCWDLLRQRRARREVGDDPDAAAPRDIGTVERYIG